MEIKIITFVIELGVKSIVALHNEGQVQVIIFSKVRSKLAIKDQEIIFTALLQLCNSTGSFPTIILHDLQLFNPQFCSSSTAALQTMLQLYRSSVVGLQ